MANVGFFDDEASAKLFPPEFYLLGLKYEKWTPIDSLANIVLINFSLTWDWAQDFMREVNKMESEELANLADELTPYTKNYLNNMVTVLDDSDVKRLGKWSDKPLSEVFLESIDHLKSAEPKRDWNIKSSSNDNKKVNYGMGGDSTNEAMHSNNWVISGKHTTTGKPMLANDPHLGAAIPSFWTLNEVVWEDKFLIGGSTPGVPLIGIGKSKNISWGQTSALCDTSDLWQETVNEDVTKYFVDGAWRDLTIVKETIKIKGKPDQSLLIRFTHRGPLMQPKTMKSGGVLFGGTLPEPKHEFWYSHAWGGMTPGEGLMQIVKHISNGIGVTELFSKIEEEFKDGYRGIPMNFVVADNAGDIGYMMLAAYPNRKDKTPFIGNRVLNGETT